MRWLIAGEFATELAGDPSAAVFLNGSSPFIVQRSRGLRIPPEWNAVRVWTFASYRDMQQTFERGGVGPDVQAIMYDNEAWKFTPRDEQLDPARYTRLAAQLVHAHHLMFIAAPATDLVGILAPHSRAGRRYDAYIRLRLAETAAQWADVYDVQAQGSQRNVRVFTDFVRRAAERAHRVNPKVIVLAGVSTNPSGQPTSAAEILAAIRATRPFVDGYWLNVPKAGPQCPRCTAYRPDIAREVLHNAR